MYRAALLLALITAGCSDATFPATTAIDAGGDDAGVADATAGIDSQHDAVPHDVEGRSDGGDGPRDAGPDSAGDLTSDAEVDTPADSLDAPDTPIDLPDDTPDATVDPDVVDVDTMADADSGPDLPVHPLDDTLRLNQLQALGTHNSYHVQPAIPVPEWAYSHLPLDEQLGMQGVRQFELDLNWDLFGRRFRVFHVPVIDDVTTCDDMITCLNVLHGWSLAHPAHHPMLVMLEMKSGDGAAAEQLEVLHSEILAVWPRESVIAPDDVRGDFETLREAVTQAGWPTLGASRGKILFVLHASGGWRRALLDGAPSAEGKLIFPDTFDDTDEPFAAFRSINDPVANGSDIAEAVRAGFLVRTRSDSNGVEARARDFDRAAAAFESGAQFVSTDFPYPPSDDAYGVVVPGGTPSRCNPLIAPMSCFSQAVEDPRAILP